MTVLEMTNYYSQNLEQISISLEEGETMILLGASAKKDVFLGILSLQKSKMGEISLFKGKKRKNKPSVVFAEDFFPRNISPEKWERVYGAFYHNFSPKTYDSYLERLNLSKKVEIKEEWDAYKLALALALTQKPSLFLLELPDLEEKEEKMPWKQTLRDCKRVIQEETMAKIISAPSLSALENWKLDGCPISIFARKKLLCSLPYEDLELVKISCSFDHCKTIPPTDYLWKEAERDSVTLVGLKSENKLQDSEEFKINPSSLSEFMEIIGEVKHDSK